MLVDIVTFEDYFQVPLRLSHVAGRVTLGEMR